MQSTNPIASLSKYPARAILTTALTGKFISIRLSLDRSTIPAELY
ncbi:hypothetical protein [Chamaesiphon sp. OTE_20_metabat_361]|nr:hypothetical protein [Chamaesiphon sp. OTE_20_metabat_361]